MFVCFLQFSAALHLSVQLVSKCLNENVATLIFSDMATHVLCRLIVDIGNSSLKCKLIVSFQHNF